jgi:Zn finger protein HypA/HybF involved in hydrogenase expression
MHEYALVDELLERVARLPLGADGAPVWRVLIRYGPGLTPDAVRQAFLSQAAGTRFAHAHVDLERLESFVDCPCGLRLFPAELHDHGGGFHDHAEPYLVCSSCGKVQDVPHLNTLELVRVDC